MTKMGSKAELFVQHMVALHQESNCLEMLNQIQAVGGAPRLKENESAQLILKSLLWPIPTEADFYVLANFIEGRQVSRNIFSIGCGTGLLEYLLLQYLNYDCTNGEDGAAGGAGGGLQGGAEASATHPKGSAESGLQGWTESGGQGGTESGGQGGTESGGQGGAESGGQGVGEPGSEGGGEGGPSAPYRVTGIEIDSLWWQSKYAPPLFLPVLYVGENFSSETTWGEPNSLVLFSYFNNLNVFAEYLRGFQGHYVAIIGPVQKEDGPILTQYCAPNPLDLRDNAQGLFPPMEWGLVLFQSFGLSDMDYIGIYARIEF